MSDAHALHDVHISHAMRPCSCAFTTPQRDHSMTQQLYSPASSVLMSSSYMPCLPGEHGVAGASDKASHSVPHLVWQRDGGGSAGTRAL